MGESGSVAKTINEYHLKSEYQTRSSRSYLLQYSRRGPEKKKGQGERGEGVVRVRKRGPATDHPQLANPTPPFNATFLPLHWKRHKSLLGDLSVLRNTGSDSFPGGNPGGWDWDQEGGKQADEN